MFLTVCFPFCRRSVQLAPREQELNAFARSSDNVKAQVPSSEVIDKASFFDHDAKDEFASDLEDPTSNFVPKQLRPVPAFYPLEKSCRFVDDSLSAVAARISDCLRVLSVQAMYNNDTVSCFVC